MIRCLLVLALLTCHLRPLAACPPSANVCVAQQRVVKQAVVVQHAHAAQAVVSYAQPVIVKQVAAQQVPYYWSVGQYQQEEAVARSIEKLIETRIQQSLEKALQNREYKSQTGFVHPGAKLAQERCAVCHSTGAAKVSEGAPLLFDALGAWQGTPEQANAALRAVNEGRMPPPPKPGFDTTDFIVFQDYLKTVLGEKK